MSPSPLSEALRLVLVGRTALSAVLDPLLPDDDRERGDVPGWVLVTLMTAGLVTVLWALAGATLQEMFTQAVGGVTGPGAG